MGTGKSGRSPMESSLLAPVGVKYKAPWIAPVTTACVVMSVMTCVHWTVEWLYHLTQQPQKQGLEASRTWTNTQTALPGPEHPVTAAQML